MTDLLAKKYNFLYAIFKIRYHHIVKNLEEDVQIEHQLKKAFQSFYEEHEDYIQSVSDFDSHGDQLMKKVLIHEKAFENEGNISNHPNVVKRVKMIAVKQ